VVVGCCAHGDENGTGTNDAWGFGEEKVEGSSTDVRDGEDLIQFDGNGNGNDGDAIADLMRIVPGRVATLTSMNLPVLVVPGMIPVVEEERGLWRSLPSCRDVVESRDDIADKYVLLHAEEKEQVLNLCSTKIHS